MVRIQASLSAAVAVIDDPVPPATAAESPSAAAPSVGSVPKNFVPRLANFFSLYSVVNSVPAPPITLEKADGIFPALSLIPEVIASLPNTASAIPPTVPAIFA